MADKRFVIRKYIMAKSALDAIRKDKQTPVDDCWIDNDWLLENNKREIGFNAEKETRRSKR